MATAQATREATSKPEVYVQRKLAELCTRIQRVELLSQVLILGLIVLSYACLIGWYDYLVGATSLIRWIGFIALVCVLGYGCVQTIRTAFQRVNPYYVAHQLEHHLPESKNSLINWLDLHDEELPGAFQKNLSARAAEQLRDGKPDQALRQRKHWVLLGAASLPLAGLLVLLLLGPGAFFLSMLQAFAPFYVPADGSRTQITIVEPKGGDAEVSPVESVPFAVKIDGRAPSKSDAPRLHYRYQASEDYLSFPLQQNADGMWVGQLSSSQLRTGFTYKVTAGDAETPLHQIKVRGRLHATKFDVAIEPRGYRKIAKTTKSFVSKPYVHGMRGDEVELTVRANRPVQVPAVEILTNGVPKKIVGRAIAGDANAFVCRWTLESTAQFRVIFTGLDGEMNADSDWHPIDVRADAAPTVVLTTPGKDISIAENGTLTLEGRASDDVGIKTLTLHLRAPTAPDLAPIPYRLDTAATEIDYLEVIALDQLKNAKGTFILLPAGTVLEVWLEATDHADFPEAKGNIGKSTVYKVLLTPTPKDARAQKAQQDQRKKELARKDEHAKAQQQEKDKKSNGKNGGGAKDPQKDADSLAKQNKEDEARIQKALDEQKNGAAKDADPKSGEPKGNPPPEPGAPEPQSKSQTPMSPEDTGNSKENNTGDKEKPGEAKAGNGEKKKTNDSKGDRKDGPPENGSSAKSDGPTKMEDGPGSTKEAGSMGAEAPPTTLPKNDMGDAPAAAAKGSNPPTNEESHGDAKGAEQNGPETTNKHQHAAKNALPNAQAKGGMNDAGDKGEPKQGVGEPGAARDNERNADAKNPDLRDLAQKLDDLSKDGAAGDKAAKEFADLAKNASDPAVRDLSKEILDKHGRDAKTGKKGPNPFGSSGQSLGVSDELKTTIANREFAARIGQLQLEHWKKNLTPELLKRAGLSDADWQRFLKNRQAHDALVRQLNAKLVRDKVAESRSDTGARIGAGPIAVQNVGASGERLDAGSVVGPPEDLEAQRRLLKK